MDVARLDAGHFTLERGVTPIAPAVEEVLEVHRAAAAEKGIRLESGTSAELPQLDADRDRLLQILDNLLSNAIKFSPVGEHVDVVAALREPAHVEIRVTDRGPGIALEDQKVIFEKFRQIDGSVTRQHSGTGLGLAISKELAVLLGGEIGVESEPGKGATFWLAIPLKVEAGTKDVRAQLIFA
jgi:signal transduction histidine kinase